MADGQKPLLAISHKRSAISSEKKFGTWRVKRCLTVGEAAALSRRNFNGYNHFLTRGWRSDHLGEIR